MQPIDVTNKFGVDFAAQIIQLHSPPRGPFGARDAYLLAAYLVAAADKVADREQDGQFSDWLRAIELVATPAKSAA